MSGTGSGLPKASYVPLAGMVGRNDGTSGSKRVVTKMGKLDARVPAVAPEDMANKSFAKADLTGPCLLDEYPDEEGFYHCIRVRSVMKREEQETPPLDTKVKTSEAEAELTAKSAWNNVTCTTGFQPWANQCWSNGSRQFCLAIVFIIPRLPP